MSIHNSTAVIVEVQIVSELCHGKMCLEIEDNLVNKEKVLTHCSLETPKRVIGKQCRPRSYAAEYGI